MPEHLSTYFLKLYIYILKYSISLIYIRLLKIEMVVNSIELQKKYFKTVSSKNSLHFTQTHPDYKINTHPSRWRSNERFFKIK